ncbi:(2,3-dihydroxybenzoyl)adenylate synthase [Crossiella cryophila]|uniref:Mycobactin salicyl-AMP ligase n=1 Tax=Crossiella cryophila TaxID=43355 RepID=A0A7W7FSR6_9PSEU|nr:AMP-binding protein [Crossiella cryophila]MBB4677331.1 mycobactin salicyl-AMP ligase [Crossiella cryophila]
MTENQSTLDGFVPWPDEYARRYREAGHWQDVPIGELLRDWAFRHGDRTALVDGDRKISYAQLDATADRMAAGLLGLGIAPGDRVVVQLPNVAEFVVLLFALLRVGAVPALTLPAHRSHEIGHLAELAEAVAYVIPDTFGGFDYRGLAREVVARVPSVKHVLVLGDPGDVGIPLSTVDADLVDLPEVNPADVAVLLVSGGTTGLPKLIPRTHNDYAYNARASAEVCELTQDDVYLVALPVAHNFPLACPGVLGILGVGGSAVFLSDPSPDNAFPLIERTGATVTALVPPLAMLWGQATEWEDGDLSSLRLLQVGGAKLAPEPARALPGQLDCRLQQVFGMAEGLLNYTRADDDDEIVAISQGRPLSAEDELRVVDAEGDDVPAGETGELLVRGPYTIRGYYRAAKHNETAITPDGYYRSGDLVRQLPSGHLIVTGRVKEVINRGGENVSAEELEEHLLAHPGIRQVAVIPVPDDMLGERVCAVIVPEGEAPALRELKTFLTGRGLAQYKLPDLLELAADLPRTAVGKIDKREVAARLAKP